MLGRPLLFRTDALLALPYLAQVGVDEADISNPELTTIMAHEFGHCLGISRLEWMAAI